MQKLKNSRHCDPAEGGESNLSNFQRKIIQRSDTTDCFVVFCLRKKSPRNDCVCLGLETARPRKNCGCLTRRKKSIGIFYSLNFNFTLVLKLLDVVIKLKLERMRAQRKRLNFAFKFVIYPCFDNVFGKDVSF